MNVEKKQHPKAIALSYDSSIHSAPRLTAKGKGKVAENIIKIAKEQKIPIQDDPTLVELLSQLKINETIPDELYQVVAEIFAFIYKVDKKLDA
ncbi:EscU/YscU/HrcU family type III secretion system export apparatus switch protein [Bacillus luteolus]|uniref:EscU/YscU/HrcU family type III secretion system export apparatus switch protein n=1 Tax=Litchfieldia luteola TaxID=682179 RepID=A0ABR9QKP1_9BACI|nr:EscU/YscU/HrcU family type III secretion system export apparatus switch protein [Cytobacillus luteolus]MBE4908744.1 EscU/YscU/HrcU family type III secretion system export apparatus switch protein [Cytobacillus luteolus]MBP1941603.1 flagellar biosynthesis protein [Cytobacillus luteolus]